MFSWLKKHFIPHEGNDHRPHILRGKNIRNIIAIVIFLEIFTFLIPILSHLNMTGGMAAVLPAVLADLTNTERQSQNLPVLQVNSVLNQAAEMKAKDMAVNEYFAHTSPEGKTPWYWLEKAGYQYQYAGENLAINFSDSVDVTNAWMNSPTHKANIVKRDYTEVGTGIAKGMYEGRETVFVAQIYANPLPNVAEQIQIKKVDLKTKEEIPKVAVAETPTNVLGAEVVSTATTQPIKDPTFWQKLVASPRNTMNTILYFVFGIITIAFLLYVFIKTRNHHKDLMTNGLIVLSIVGAIFIVNYYWSQKNMVIAQSLDYSNEIK